MIEFFLLIAVQPEIDGIHIQHNLIGRVIRQTAPTSNRGCESIFIFVEISIR